MARAKQPAARPAPKKSATKKEAGAKAPASSASKAAAASKITGAEAQAQLDGFIDRYTPAMAALGRSTLAHMRKRLPGAVSLVYDNYNALVIGFGPDAKVGHTPFSVALYPKWLNLFFLMGGRIDDPNGLMRGSGPLIRNVKITSVADLRDKRLDALITAAVLDCAWKLDPKAKNQLVIQSISPTQRPRRP
jgi:hypothetical protein